MHRLFLGGLAALFALVVAKIPVWGIVKLEQSFNSYPLISQETADSMTELTAAYAEFDRACYCYKSGAGASVSGESCEGVANEAALKQAKNHRKAAAARLNPNLLTAVVLGVNYHTHSTWQCSGSSYDPIVDVNLGISPTYDPA